MILELFSTAALAFCAWGILLMAFKLFSRKPPKYLVPMVIGLAILGFNIYNEYSWRDRAASGLPDGLEVVQEITSKSLFRPWTMVFPKVSKLVLVDTQNIQRNAKLPNMVMTETAVMSRFQNTYTALHMIDCVNRRRADILPDTTMGEDGMPRDVQWRNLQAENRLLILACAQN